MLEADILMGTHNHFEDVQPIMAHPPHTTSNLTFVQFLDSVIKATTSEGKRKGIKLDFKDGNAVESCLKILRARLELPESPPIPVIINADILQGPVNSTKKPINAEKFISLTKEYAPFAILSIGWTTRYGMDDPSDEIRDGQYTKQDMKEMVKVIKLYAGDKPVFPHITFPVRAGLAAHSTDALLYLMARIRTDHSITLWSTKTDPVNRRALQSLIDQATRHHVFMDLPFSLDDDQDDDSDSIVVEGDPNLSAIQQLEGRGESETDTTPASSNSARLSFNVYSILPVIAVGLISTAFFVYRRL